MNCVWIWDLGFMLSSGMNDITKVMRNALVVCE